MGGWWGASVVGGFLLFLYLQLGCRYNIVCIHAWRRVDYQIPAGSRGICGVDVMGLVLAKCREYQASERAINNSVASES